MKIKKIIIVGGGSSGWISAAVLKKQLPELDITLIESPDVPIIGVGESTLPQINALMSLLDIKDQDFMPHTDATYKISIRFEDFYKKGDGGFFYPFGTPYESPYKNGKTTWLIKKILEENTKNKDYVDCLYPFMSLIKNNTFSLNEENDIPNFNPKTDVTYHFDAIKFGLWLRDHYCIPKGVKYIKEHISNIEQDDNGIKSLNNKYSADLYIDCSGFQALLIDKTLKEPFESYSDIIPNDSAWATQISYKDKEKELVPYTNCTAIQNGWVWAVGTWKRMGTGYVYSSKHVTDEEALIEFKNYLTTIGKDYSNSKFRNIKMRVGMHKRLFVKNVVAIGLSGAFIEPLEATGLLTTHDFIMLLVRVLKRDKNEIVVSQFDRDNFTSICKYIFRNAAEFVSLHYALSHRTDTKYWQDINKKQFSKDLVELNNPILIGFLYASMRRYHRNSFDSIGGLHCISTGMNYLPMDEISEIYYSYDNNLKVKLNNEYKDSINLMNSNKEKWENICKNKQTYLSFLEQYIYNEKN
jgi:tryptophan halogenase